MEAGSDTPAEPSGTASYAPVPLLTLMTTETRDHRLWLPWVTANHLHGIAGLEAYDPHLLEELTAEPARGGR